MAECVLSMHEVVGFIPAFSSMHEVDLIDQLGERQTEDNVSSHLKSQCSIHGQSTIQVLKTLAVINI